MSPVQDAYQAIAVYWADSGGHYQIPVNPFLIAHRAGIGVYTRDLPARCGGRFEGPDIVINSRYPLEARRMECARLLGQEMGRRTYESIPAVYPDRFAAALLMPVGELDRLRAQEIPDHLLVARFEVSVDLLRWRCAELDQSRRTARS